MKFLSFILCALLLTTSCAKDCESPLSFYVIEPLNISPTLTAVHGNNKHENFKPMAVDLNNYKEHKKYEQTLNNGNALIIPRLIKEICNDPEPLNKACADIINTNFLNLKKELVAYRNNQLNNLTPIFNPIINQCTEEAKILRSTFATHDVYLDSHIVTYEDCLSFVTNNMKATSKQLVAPATPLEPNDTSTPVVNSKQTTIHEPVTQPEPKTEKANSTYYDYGKCQSIVKDQKRNKENTDLLLKEFKNEKCDPSVFKIDD